jgi:hypothetical protein
MSLFVSPLPSFCLYIHIINDFSYLYFVYLKLFHLKVSIPSIYHRTAAPSSSRQPGTRMLCNTVTVSVTIGVTGNRYLSIAEDSTPIAPTLDSLSVSAGDWVFAATLSHAEEEGVGARVGERYQRGVPVGCCKATKYEAVGSLHHSERPPLPIATPVEILCSPAITGSIIDPLEPCLRILLSHESDDHVSVGGRPKGLRGVIF